MNTYSRKLVPWVYFSGKQSDAKYAHYSGTIQPEIKYVLGVQGVDNFISIQFGFRLSKWETVQSLLSAADYIPLDHVKSNVDLDSLQIIPVQLYLSYMGETKHLE